MEEVKNLSLMKVGEIGFVESISSQAGALKRRLLDMGIVKGSQITVKKLAPLGDPIEIIVKNYSLSLRKIEAQAIEVKINA
jgi:ferrous iron transport protein A